MTSPLPNTMIKSSSTCSFFCAVCMETLPNSEAVRANEKRCISHPPFCKQCTIKHLEVTVTAVKCVAIKCMSKGCRSNFDALRCRDLKLISRDVFQQWCDLLCEASVLGHERCYCPNLSCNELIIDECSITEPATGPRSARRIDCPNCKIYFCFRCFSPWNNDHHSCLDNENNDAIILVERENWVKCPGCKNYVQRNQGCLKITCRCNTVFCYRCGRKPWDCCGYLSYLNPRIYPPLRFTTPIESQPRLLCLRLLYVVYTLACLGYLWWKYVLGKYVNI